VSDLQFTKNEYCMICVDFDDDDDDDDDDDESL